MKTNNILLLFAGMLSFSAAVFQLVISIVPEWSVFFGSGDELVSNPPLLTASGLEVTIILADLGLTLVFGCRPAPQDAAATTLAGFAAVIQETRH